MSTSDLTTVRSPRFNDTHWSRVIKAARDDEHGKIALNQLCQSYWLPLYSYVRHRGICPTEAQDITQDFFVDLISREALQKANQNKGRFRWFLLGCLKNFLHNEWDRRRTIKRGGRCTFASLDGPGAEALYADFADSQLNPDTVFDRTWALSLLEQALVQLREDYRAEGRLTTFEVLQSVLSKDGRTISFAEAARELAITEEATRMAAMRLRRRFGTLLQRQILKTVADPAEAEEELRYLFSCL